MAYIRQRDRLLEPTGFEDAYEFAGDDGVAILLDPFRDRRNAVVFATTCRTARSSLLHHFQRVGSFQCRLARRLDGAHGRRVPEG